MIRLIEEADLGTEHLKCFIFLEPPQPLPTDESIVEWAHSDNLPQIVVVAATFGDKLHESLMTANRSNNSHLFEQATLPGWGVDVTHECQLHRNERAKWLRENIGKCRYATKRFIEGTKVKAMEKAMSYIDAQKKIISNLISENNRILACREDQIKRRADSIRYWFGDEEIPDGIE